MECHCDNGTKVKHLVQVINSQVIALQQLLTNEQNINHHHPLVQIIHNLQSSVQNEGNTIISFPQSSDQGQSRYTTPTSILYPLVTVESRDLSLTSSALQPSTSNPNTDIHTTLEVGEFLTNILKVDDHKHQPKPKIVSRTKKSTSSSSGKGKKRKVSAENWKRNVNKEKRMKGEEYFGIKRVPVPIEGESPGTCAYKYKFLQAAARPSRKVGPRCTKHLEKTSTNCTGFQCFKISEEVRQGIFEYFWKKLDWGQRKIYISALVTVNKVQRRRSTSGNSNRSDSYKYYLRNPNFEMIRVCKSFFVSTFDVGDRVVRDWVQIPKFPLPQPSNEITSNDESDHKPI